MFPRCRRLHRVVHCDVKCFRLHELVPLSRENERQPVEDYHCHRRTNRKVLLFFFPRKVTIFLPHLFGRQGHQATRSYEKAATPHSPEEERCGFVFQAGSEETPPDVIPPVRNGVSFADLHLRNQSHQEVTTRKLYRNRGVTAGRGMHLDNRLHLTHKAFEIVSFRSRPAASRHPFKPRSP